MTDDQKTLKWRLYPIAKDICPRKVQRKSTTRDHSPPFSALNAVPGILSSANPAWLAKNATMVNFVENSSQNRTKKFPFTSK